MRNLFIMKRFLCPQMGLRFWRPFHVCPPEPTTEFLKIKDVKSGNPREIAFKKLGGSRSNGIFFIPGFMAHKSGTKASSLHRFSGEYEFPYLRYDPAGLGESVSLPLKDARLSHWRQDAKEIFLTVTDGPQIVVASSMGAWCGLSLAEDYPDKFAGLVLIAPTFNTTQQYFDKISKELPNSAIDRLRKGGSVTLTHPEYGTFPVSYGLVEDMFENELDVSRGLHIRCPVRIIHGIKDSDVPYKSSLDILKLIHSADVTLTYIKDGDHRLSEERNLQILFDTILKLDDTVTKRKRNL